jgi:hypothetical protein
MLADDLLKKIKLKMFHAEIINDADKLNEEVSRYNDTPVVSNITQQQVLDNYYQVKREVKRLMGEKVERWRNKVDASITAASFCSLALLPNFLVVRTIIRIF